MNQREPVTSSGESIEMFRSGALRVLEVGGGADAIHLAVEDPDEARRGMIRSYVRQLGNPIEELADADVSWDLAFTPRDPHEIAGMELLMRVECQAPVPFECKVLFDLDNIYFREVVRDIEKAGKVRLLFAEVGDLSRDGIDRVAARYGVPLDAGVRSGLRLWTAARRILVNLHDCQR